MISLCDLPVDILSLNKEYQPMFLRQYKKNKILIGSYFCDTYFIKTVDSTVEFLIEELDPIDVSIVLPIFRQEYLEKAKNKIDTIINKLNELCSEIIVNDPGMLFWIENRFRKHRIALGRLFYKNARDPRMPWYRTDDVFGLVSNLCQTYNLQGHLHAVEIDQLEECDIDFKGIEVRLHRPFVFLTTGFICKSGSMHLDTEHKFRPSIKCKQECCDIAEISHWIDPPAEMIRLGRTVYVATKHNLSDYSKWKDDVIWWPVLDVAKMKGWLDPNEVISANK